MAPTQHTSAAADLGLLVPVLFGHAAFQQLNAGCRLGLFDLLNAEGPLSAERISERLDLPPRSCDVLLLGTTALGLTAIDADGYRNGPPVAAAFGAGLWPVLRDIVEFQDRIAYLPAADYAESLRTGRNVGIRHFPGTTEDLYSRLSGVPGLEDLFYRCMHSWSRLSNPVLVAHPAFPQARRVLDVGGGDAVNAVALARAHPGLRVTVMDREGALAAARRTIGAAGLADRIATHAADIFAGVYPHGHDCVLFAHQLVIWSAEQNLALLRTAYEALPPGGAVLVFNAFADDDRTGPLYAALDNVYFSTLPFRDSTLYRWEECEGWLREAGFTDVRRTAGTGWTPHGVVSGRRPEH
ncbi:methyltransferase [Streptomonospora nanhaiensis]|uniref:Ubiquinone/menaquinone biosynthesis C-methylase UbiE n=1 Tax=Streptomonospora nanhaiensis TaxID=1323731 RepID=A0A853BWR6_9ACTN|nr:methyltransferase [Streptomonospora nanhaiensis]MBV2366913.1 methyltransferase domain-containing protein [Streptomonospora nanhaiensis]MBX9391609.1 methyltransferase domain-containing protein [Streptomonospora nanhaiensis]NYI99195.1 ubiquinone/menaquinone biosynthesis C-methylase UbiE [Streptomonospora nanhaiensis]